MRRVTWFVSGALAGAAGVGYAKRKVRATAAQLAPSQVASNAVARARDRVGELADALREGRTAMRMKEAELRAVRDGRPEALAPELLPGDQLLVDGRPVEPGRVIVLRQVAAEREGAPRRRRAR
jgi:hypothetical protein